MHRVFLLLLSIYLIECFSLLLLMQFSNNLNQNMNLHIDTESIRVPLHMSLSNQSPSRLVHDVNCRAIFKGDASEIEKANNLMKLNILRRKRIEDREYIQMTNNCVKFRSARGYDNHKPSSEEALFPIAYSILLYKDVQQFERLLCAIYSPYNYFCLHIDADARQEIHDAVRGIANCFNNVFIVHRNEFIVYAGFSRLQADLNCIEELLQNWPDWKYFINLPSQEFPLKTNQEIVRILKTLNGANDISGLTGYRSLLHRYKHRHIYKHVNESVKAELFETNQEKESPPYNITLVKGSAYGIFSRDFVHFAANNKIARELLFYLQDVYSPDEYFWASLNFNLHIKAPGSYYRGRPEDKPYLTVYASWSGLNECNGKFVRRVCVFGVADLRSLSEKHHLFANKFHIDFQPYALDCMEEWHLNRTAEGNSNLLNISFYESLPFIKCRNCN